MKGALHAPVLLNRAHNLIKKTGKISLVICLNCTDRPCLLCLISDISHLLYIGMLCCVKQSVDLAN